jgi:DNA polymerase LigD, polymerase domain
MRPILQDKFKNSLKNLDKVFWPDDGYKKGDIMRYYSEIWPYIRPHLFNRPVSLVRYPEGISGNFFYQKDVPEPPSWVETVIVKSEERLINYAMINRLETLIWSVNLGCIEVHPWLSTITSIDHPTYIIFDLDPMEPAVFSDAVKIALSIRTILRELNLQSFPKISGATGIHIYLPIHTGYAYKQTSNFVKQMGILIINALPALATNERQVAKRAGKVYIDHLQNLKGKTIASVYSIRPFPGAPVSTPVSWDELPDCHPSMFTIQTVPKRLQKVGDIFQPLLSLKQKLPEI